MSSSAGAGQHEAGEPTRGLVEGLREHFRDSPTALFLCLSWILVFAAMLLYQRGLAGGGDLLTGGISPLTGLRFGAQMTAFLKDGELWRSLTASFVHFSLLHLMVNLAGLYQLSPLLESWYGGAQFLAVYVVIATLGNLLAAGSKLLLAAQFPGYPAFQDLPSAGGSVVLVGLVALLAVVGWRSRTQFGDYIRAQMVGFLAFTALLGVMVPHIDNFGHAGGAVIGALVGFVHRPMLRRFEAGKNRWTGVLAAIVIAGAAVAQYVYGRLPEPPVVERLSPQQRASKAESAIQDLVRLHLFYQQLALLGPEPQPKLDLAMPFDPLTGRPRGISPTVTSNLIRAIVKHLDEQESGLEVGPTAPAYQTLRRLALTATERAPTPGEVALFQQSLAFLLQQAANWLNQARSEMPAAAVAPQKVPKKQAEKTGTAQPPPPEPPGEEVPAQKPEPGPDQPDEEPAEARPGSEGTAGSSVDRPAREPHALAMAGTARALVQ